MSHREREAELLTRINELEGQVKQLQDELDKYKKQPTTILDLIKREK
jgi:BMFP domain-containing protein YqiC